MPGRVRERIRDITHVALQRGRCSSRWWRAAHSADVEFLSPVAEADKLQPVTVTAAVGPVLADLVDSFNLNVEKLNGRMFTFLDYAVIATR
jgi:hypothetical protein